jgi:hypothetical protein
MRLDDVTKNKIVSAVKSLFASYSGELRLYGSRVHDDLKGGDIDLVFLLSPPGHAAEVTVGMHIVTAAIKMAIGEQKIDFSIVDQTRRDDPFWSMALSESIVLAHW